MALSPKASKGVLLASLAVVGIVSVAAAARRKESIKPRQVFGIGGAYIVAAALIDSAPRVGASISALVATGVVLRQGVDAAQGIASIASGETKIQFPELPSAAVFASALDPIVRDSDGNVVPGGTPGPGITPDRGSNTNDPRIIGRPYAGTHTRPGWPSGNAVDIRLPVGTPIYAPVDGVVTKTHDGGADNGSNALAGWQVSVQGSPDVFVTHLSRVAVVQGSRVRAGDALGLSGTANGVPHLHGSVAPPASPYGYWKRMIGER